MRFSVAAAAAATLLSAASVQAVDHLVKVGANGGVGSGHLAYYMPGSLILFVSLSSIPQTSLPSMETPSPSNCKYFLTVSWILLNRFQYLARARTT
jgi:hypothetical protein